MEFKLPYYVSNGGDGSATTRFYPNLKEAEKADGAQSEGWGESSANEVRLKVEDGKLFFWGWPPEPDDECDDETYEKWKAQWIEVKP